MGYDIGSVAGHEQQFDIRIKRCQLPCQIPAVHPGHNHIRHEQMNFICMIPGHLNGLSRCGRG